MLGFLLSFLVVKEPKKEAGRRLRLNRKNKNSLNQKPALNVFVQLFFLYNYNNTKQLGNFNTRFGLLGQTPFYHKTKPTKRTHFAYKRDKLIQKKLQLFYLQNALFAGTVFPF